MHRITSISIHIRYSLAVTKPNTKSGDAIYQLASEGIDYLDSRTDFWRQQEPLYARSKAIKKPEGDGEAYKYIHRELETIDNCKTDLTMIIHLHLQSFVFSNFSAKQ